MYVHPPTSQAIDQGLILRDIYFFGPDKTRLGIVVTPTCDFEQGKVDYVQLCSVQEATDVLKKLRAGPWKERGKKNITGEIRAIITQNRPRLHWLSPLPGTVTPLIIDFQVVQSIPISELTNAQIVAELKSPFREQIPARYVAYMGRVGTPDLAEEEIKHWSTEGADLLVPDEE